MPAIEDLLGAVRSRLANAASPRAREGALRFFREPVNPLGVPTPDVKRIAAAAYRELKRWPLALRNRFCTELWKCGVLEEGVVAIYVYRRFAQQCARCEFHLFEKWIDRFVRNWAHCDGVSAWLLAAAIANEPELSAELSAWTGSPNRWKRRAAAVALVQEAKHGQNTDAILKIAARLLDDPDDMVQKGVGWLLKEAYPKKKREVVAFLKRQKKRATRLVLRYAAEKMTAADRAAVLG
jgi:3-methyladenine DNA glycosylase AlkD